MQVNELLVAPHLESIPSLRTFTTRSFPCSYSQSLGRHPNWSFHFEILFLCASDQVSTHLLQRLHIAAGESDPNPVNGHLGLHGSLAGVFKSHGCSVASWPTCSSARANSGESEAGPGSTEFCCSSDRVFLKELIFLLLIFCLNCAACRILFIVLQPETEPMPWSGRVESLTTVLLREVVLALCWHSPGQGNRI